SVRAAGQEDGVAPLEVIQAIQARQAEIASKFGHHARNRDVAGWLAGHERKVRGDVDCTDIVGLLRRAVETESRGVERSRRESVLIFQRQVLIARTFFGESDRRLVESLAIDVAVVERVTSPQVVTRRKLMVNAPLDEIFIGRLRLCEEIFRHASSKVASVRQWEEGLQISRNRRVQRDRRPAGQPALPRIGVGHGRDSGDAQPFDQRFISGEEEGPVFANRAADGAPELIALESWNLLIRRIEEVLRVESRIAMKLEERSVESVLA